MAEQLPCGCIPGTATRCEEGQRLQDEAEAAYRTWVWWRPRWQRRLWAKYERARADFFAHQERQGAAS